MLSSNSVPRMGRRASEMDNPLSEMDNSLPEMDNPLPLFLAQYPFPRLLRKRFRFKKRGNNLPGWLRADFARVGKRGPPSFGIPDHWRGTPEKREAGTLAELR